MPRAIILNGHTLKITRFGTSLEVQGLKDFPGGSDGKASAYSVGDPGSIPGWGRSPGEGNGTPLQYSCLENPRDGGAWWATVHGVAKSRTRLSNFTFQGLKPCASTEGGSGSIFGSGTKIPHAARCGQKSKKKTLQTTLLEAYWIHPSFVWASLVSQMVKNLPVMRETGFDPWVGRIPWRRAWQSTLVFFFFWKENHFILISSQTITAAKHV